MPRQRGALPSAPPLSKGQKLLLVEGFIKYKSAYGTNVWSRLNTDLFGDINRQVLNDFNSAVAGQYKAGDGEFLCTQHGARVLREVVALVVALNEQEFESVLDELDDDLSVDARQEYLAADLLQMHADRRTTAVNKYNKLVGRRPPAARPAGRGTHPADPARPLKDGGAFAAEFAYRPSSVRGMDMHPENVIRRQQQERQQRGVDEWAWSECPEGYEQSYACPGNEQLVRSASDRVDAGNLLHSLLTQFGRMVSDLDTDGVIEFFNVQGHGFTIGVCVDEWVGHMMRAATTCRHLKFLQDIVDRVVLPQMRPDCRDETTRNFWAAHANQEARIKVLVSPLIVADWAGAGATASRRAPAADATGHAWRGSPACSPSHEARA